MAPQDQPPGEAERAHQGQAEGRRGRPAGSRRWPSSVK
ncbi:Uncharacterised protein [Amycolatopsis camponoti]|uniref:Uncharacterized protein n=1 Tax=Amycolatopsis camponoti TaxID=2606593 RepID=A0A6I8LX41_9PSEU|nr:Uncharacterised protein [Amycolatopsis camponoti]